MRLRVIALFVVSVSGCSSSEVTTTITSSSGSAQKPATSAAKSAAAPASTATPTASATGAPAAAMRDAEAELKAIDPFNETASDGAQRLLTAISLCGEPLKSAPWGKDAPSTPVGTISRCAPASHAKLYMKSAAMSADSKSPEVKKTAEEHAYLALALDPAATLPAGASPAANDVLTAAKKRPVPTVRRGAVSTSDEATQKELEKSVDGELTAAVRFCYASGLLNNPNLEGAINIGALVAADGSLSGSAGQGSLPDSGVISCVLALANRSRVSAPGKAPATVSIPFICSPGGK